VGLSAAGFVEDSSTGIVTGATSISVERLLRLQTLQVDTSYPADCRATRHLHHPNFSWSYRSSPGNCRDCFNVLLPAFQRLASGV